MASGRDHARQARRVAVALSVVSLGSVAVVGPVGLAVAAGGWLGWLMTPDMDLPGVTYEERRILNFCRPLGWIWIVFWWPYPRIIPHRSPWSHLPIIATGIRMTYSLWPIIVWGELPLLFWALLLSAWSLQDLEHLRMDSFRMW